MSRVYNRITEGLADRIYRLRRSRGLSQRELADVLGLTRSSVANIESGRQDLTASGLIAAAEFFGLTVGAILGTEPMPVLPPKVTVERAGFVVRCDEHGDVAAATTSDYAERLRDAHLAEHRTPTLPPPAPPR